MAVDTFTFLMRREGRVQVVDALALLHAGNVVHFDLKLQNIFLQPDPSTPAPDFWCPRCETPPFKVVLGDFGESKMWLRRNGSADAAGGGGGSGTAAGGEGEGCMTARPRGTDFMKSPEMLANGHAVLDRARATFDRRKHGGAGAPSDMWSLGCVLYQLVFGEMLFFDPDYMRFLQRLTFGAERLLPAAAAANLAHTPVVAKLLDQLVLHAPDKRQPVDKLQGKLAHLAHAQRLDGAPAHLPPYRPPAPTAKP